MPSNDKLSDDYVASLLAKDAKDRSIRYSSYGLGALLPKRPTTNAPKPNTRFLKNIIKETDSHNAALKAKEAEEARARLRRLRGDTRRDSDSRADDDDRRPTKRQRIERDNDGVIRKGRGHKKDHLQGLGDYDDRDRETRRRHYEDESSEDERAERSRRHTHHREHRRHHSRSRDRSRDRGKLRHGHQSRRHVDRRRSQSPSRSHKDSKHRHSRHHRSPSTASSSSEINKHSKKRINGHPHPEPTNGKKKRARSPTPQSASDSDPLASIVGPPPPPSPPKVRSRGRGTYAVKSGMDERFSSTYDPTNDVHPNSDSENDWDQALEALRDRQKWKKQGADRLREAGFSEQDVQKWEKSGPSGEKREEDVVWKGKGEGREWDRGKVVMEDEDEVVTKAEWGRLK